MISVVILGTGNVGSHMIKAFSSAKNVALKQVYFRKNKQLPSLSSDVLFTSKLEELTDADVYILTISDDAIADVALKIPTEKFVVHTSGAVDLGALKNHARRGVFYPLQTFTKEQNINYKDIPICIEAALEEDLLILEALAQAIAGNVFFIDSEKRKELHLAAVFVNNFVNHLYLKGFEICIENQLPPEILYPLIQETAQKVIKTKPSDAQTGPAKRNDQQTIAKHLKMLEGNSRKIYELLTSSIQQTYGKKL